MGANGCKPQDAFPLRSGGCTSRLEACGDEVGNSCGRLMADTGQDLPHANAINHSLLTAARDGDNAKMQKAIADGACLETRRPFRMISERMYNQDSRGEPPLAHKCPGMTPLMYAAQGGFLKCTELLLSAGARVDAEDEDGMTPLHFAASSGDVDTARLLLDWGAEPTVLDKNDNSPLDYLPPEEASQKTTLNAWQELLKRRETKGPPVRRVPKTQDLFE
eukprot:TRINITY_DN26246_c0_g1_i1.p1 TRINITY_DN26246_c0_g1~~TRINITY_DN26246_c0_g1_i1.p1  ORF type:complete len:220 (+),score=58.36 TRINITY_DN26246_c0_g1_i1:141-800(+)